MNSAPTPTVVRFGVFQLDTQAGQLLKNGRVVRMKPQPFKLLQLLVLRAGEVVSRDEIRQALWPADTFVDFEQGVNSAIKQVRDALNEDAEHPLYVETVPKRGYRFTAPIEGSGAAKPVRLRTTELKLHKAMWLNIAELRLAERRRAERRRRAIMIAVIAAVLVLVAIGIVLIRR